MERKLEIAAADRADPGRSSTDLFWSKSLDSSDVVHALDEFFRHDRLAVGTDIVKDLIRIAVDDLGRLA